MNVAEAAGRALAAVGIDHVFGVVGSGNFEVTGAMVEAGATFVAARHESGATTMADAYARMGGGIAAVTVHQGCGLTNSMTGLAEAAKSRTPVVVLAAEATNPRSNFFVDQPALAAAVGARSVRADDPATAVRTVVDAVTAARRDRRVVVVNLPLETQAAPAPPTDLPTAPVPGVGEAEPTGLDRLVAALRSAERPVFVAGRGAREPGAREALELLGERCGALLATSAVAKGLFHGNPWSLDVSGGFASPLAADLVRDADLIVGWGCALNMWTMRHGRLIGEDATVAQVDLDAEAIGAHRDVAFGVVGDVTRTATDAADAVGVATRGGYRTRQVADALSARLRWRDTPYEDVGTTSTVDPRTLTIALDDLLPSERVLAVDSGNFMGYPSMFLDVPDEYGFCFTQAYQSVGLGLSTAIGAALAQPGRLPVAALGDGGALMGAAELETVVRLRLPMLVVVYNDSAYGAEVHHFADRGRDLSTVRFPDTDFAAIARGYGFEAATVRGREDLAAVSRWLASDATTPMLLDAKVTADEPSWWLADAFGH